jgi:hypothetical protein
LSYAALSQPAVLAQQVLGEGASLGLRMGLITFGILTLYVSLVALSVFTWQVFGAESGWRRALAAGVAVTALICSGLYIHANWLRLTASASVPLYGQLGMTPHYIVTFGWMSVESLRYYAQMRRRQALGLADPVVANRFLVWGAGEGVATLVVLVLLAVTVAQGQMVVADPFVSACVTLAGLVNALVWWLTFTPPAAYRRWVQGIAAQEASVG